MPNSAQTISDFLCLDPDTRARLALDESINAPERGVVAPKVDDKPKDPEDAE